MKYYGVLREFIQRSYDLENIENVRERKKKKIKYSSL